MTRHVLHLFPLSLSIISNFFALFIQFHSTQLTPSTLTPSTLSSSSLSSTSHLLPHYDTMTPSMLQVEQTACAVLDMFPDLELAVEEGTSSSFLNNIPSFRCIPFHSLPLSTTFILFITWIHTLILYLLLISFLLLSYLCISSSTPPLFPSHYFLSYFPFLPSLPLTPPLYPPHHFLLISRRAPASHSLL